MIRRKRLEEASVPSGEAGSEVSGDLVIFDKCLFFVFVILFSYEPSNIHDNAQKGHFFTGKESCADFIFSFFSFFISCVCEK